MTVYQADDEVAREAGTALALASMRRGDVVGMNVRIERLDQTLQLGAGRPQLLVELVGEDARADVVEVVGGAQALDVLAGDGAGDVDLGVVAVGERLVGVGEIREALAQLVEGFKPESLGQLVINGCFGGCLDGLILVDLTKTDPKLLSAYMGDDGAKTFLDYHDFDQVSA